MNVDIFKRNIKLQELGIELSDMEQKLLDFLNENLSGLNIYTTHTYSNPLFFGKNKDNLILKYNKENGYLYTHYDKIWSFFESKFDMEYTDIQKLIGWYVGETLNLKVNHTRFTASSNLRVLERH